MDPVIDEEVERACRNIAAVIVSMLTAYTFGMWAKTGDLDAGFLIGTVASWGVLVYGWAEARRNRLA